MKRAGGPSPIARGVGVVVIRFVTPFVVLVITDIVLTGSVAGVVRIVPVALLGLGLYVFAMGALPAKARIAR